MPERPLDNSKSHAVLSALRELEGADEDLLRRPEVAHLPSVLEDDELPGCIANFTPVGIVVATDRRIVNIRKSRWRSSIKSVESYPYRSIHSIDAGESMWEYPLALVLSGSGKRIRIDADKDWRFRFSAYVRARLPTYSVVEALRTLEGVDEKILKRPEVLHANSVLEVGELPGSIAISGQLATHLATDRRIISVQKSIWTDSIKSVQSYSFDEIQMIATGHGPLGSPIEILASGKSIRLEADEKHRLAFAEYVRTRLPSTPILEALREKLNRLDGVDENILKRTEVAHLPSVLEEGELPGCVATFGQVSMTVATDRRITHILQSMGSSSIRKVETYPYEHIKSVRAGRSVYSPGAGVPYYRLEINFSDGGTFIRMKKDSCYVIADYVTAKVNAA